MLPNAVEIENRRTKNSKHWRMENGSILAEIGHALHYYDNGWKDIDLTFRTSGNEHVVDKHDLSYKVYRRAGQHRLSAVDKSSTRGIEFTLPGSPTTSGRKVEFAKDGLSWEYTTTKSGLKLLANVSTPLGAKTFSFGYALQNNASPLTVDSEGNLVSDMFIMPRPYALGANGVRYPCSSWGITANEVSFSWDDSSLPSAAFPYELDPTTTFNILAGTDDHNVHRSGTTYPPSGTIGRVITQATVYAPGRMWDGTNYSIRNYLLRWDTSSIPDNATRDSALLRLYVIGRDNANARNVTCDWHPWDETTADYAENGDASSFAAGTTAFSVPLANIAGGGDVDFPLSNLGNLNLAGISRLRLHVDGGQPSGVNLLTVAGFEHTTLPEPRLLVTYTEVDVTAPAIPTGLTVKKVIA